jgi:hypothetical protein
LRNSGSDNLVESSSSLPSWPSFAQSPRPRSVIRVASQQRQGLTKASSMYRIGSGMSIGLNIMFMKRKKVDITDGEKRYAISLLA